MIVVFILLYISTISRTVGERYILRHHLFASLPLINTVRYPEVLSERACNAINNDLSFLFLPFFLHCIFVCWM